MSLKILLYHKINKKMFMKIRLKICSTEFMFIFYYEKLYNKIKNR